jgi:hypothetical protein
MPLNEASRKARRERWPLEFDIEGVPRDTATRKQLLEQKQQELQQEQQTENLAALFEESMSPAQTVRNSFSVDQPTVEITDINNPPRRPYNPHDPKNEFPKVLYHHETGRVLHIAAGPNAEKEQKAALKRGFELKPSPAHDYSKITRAGIAAVAEHAPKREEEMSAEELAAMDEADES